jgi:myo-inositol-1-phosphate synthase
MATGVWLVGCRGSVAVTSIVGALAIRSGLAVPVGCVTELAPLRAPLVPALTDLVFGGHDIVAVPLLKKAEALAAAGVVPARLVAAVAPELVDIEADVRMAPEAPTRAAPTQGVAAQRVVDDIAAFASRHGLDRVVVVNVASTEPAATPHPAHGGLAALREALDRPGVVLPASSLYAYGAFTAGASYVDFTPSTGARLPSLAELAVAAGLPYAGHDGKTGETLLKSVLAPMFAMRHLRVRSWSGTNLLGGGDGASLAAPAANAAKTASKQRVLRETLGYEPEGHTRIEYVPDIGDFKTAWDLVTFSGFLGTSMRLEFTWHGCDSALAAPLVLDLARLGSAAHAAGWSGPVEPLGFFFKDPLGDGPHALGDQWRALCDFVAALPARPARPGASEGGDDAPAS